MSTSLPKYKNHQAKPSLPEQLDEDAVNQLAIAAAHLTTQKQAQIALSALLQMGFNPNTTRFADFQFDWAKRSLDYAHFVAAKPDTMAPILEEVFKEGYHPDTKDHLGMSVSYRAANARKAHFMHLALNSGADILDQNKVSGRNTFNWDKTAWGHLNGIYSQPNISFGTIFKNTCQTFEFYRAAINALPPSTPAYTVERRLLHTLMTTATIHSTRTVESPKNKDLMMTASEMVQRVASPEEQTSAFEAIAFLEQRFLALNETLMPAVLGINGREAQRGNSASAYAFQIDSDALQSTIPKAHQKDFTLPISLGGALTTHLYYSIVEQNLTYDAKVYHTQFLKAHQLTQNPQSVWLANEAEILWDINDRLNEERFMRGAKKTSTSKASPDPVLIGNLHLSTTPNAPAVFLGTHPVDQIGFTLSHPLGVLVSCAANSSSRFEMSEYNQTEEIKTQTKRSTSIKALFAPILPELSSFNLNHSHFHVYTGDKTFDFSIYKGGSPRGWDELLRGFMTSEPLSTWLLDEVHQHAPKNLFTSFNTLFEPEQLAVALLTKAHDAKMIEDYPGAQIDPKVFNSQWKKLTKRFPAITSTPFTQSVLQHLEQIHRSKDSQNKNQIAVRLHQTLVDPLIFSPSKMGPELSTTYCDLLEKNLGFLLKKGYDSELLNAQFGQPARLNLLRSLEPIFQQVPRAQASIMLSHFKDLPQLKDKNHQAEFDALKESLDIDLASHSKALMKPGKALRM